MQKQLITLVVMLLLLGGGSIYLYLRLSRLEVRHTELTDYTEQTEHQLKVQKLLTQAGRDFLEGRVKEAMMGYALADSLSDDSSDWSMLLTDEIGVRDSLHLDVRRLSQNLRMAGARARMLGDTLDSLRVTLSSALNTIDSTRRQLLLTEGQLAHALLQAERQREENLAIRQSFGHLSFLNTKGKEIIYVGDIVNGRAIGKGVGIFNMKSVYHGEWKDNLRHGKGAYRWENGDLYEGDFVEGKRHGSGIYTFTTGDRYEGEWKDDVRHGKGRFISDANGISYEGFWNNDKYQRNGTDTLK